MTVERQALIIHINVVKLLEKIFILLETVKPLDLMRYLVRLVTPKNGICLDPYMGSGTTAVACKAEKLNYIGCELDEQYIKIAEARIKAEVVVYDIFDFLD